MLKITSFKPALLVCALLLPLGGATGALAQGITTERVAFAAGASGTVIAGRLQGGEIVDYVLNARGGQRMVVDMETDNASAYFNVMPAGSPEAIFIGNVEGGHFDGTLPSGGDWVIRTYLMRSAARRGETADYRISVHIGGADHSADAADFADGNAGGPDYWQVTGVAAGDHLNVRTGPSTGHAVTARVSNGQVFRNLGCQGEGSARWCHVESGDARLSGWVAGRYLSESGAPAQPSAALPASDFADGEAGGPDYWEVHGVAAGDYLNMRTGPSTRYSIVARAENGQSFRNLGCRAEGNSRWCHVQTQDGRYDGWVSGRYLREAAAPAGNATITVPSGSAVSPDVHIRGSGEIEVAWAGGCTALYNPAGGRVQAGSSCTRNQLLVSDSTAARYAR